MAEIIKMPRLSDTMEEGNIVGWLKKVGDKVSPGDILAEVETDKATMELESFYEGTLLHIGVPEGPVAIGALLAIIGKDGEDISALLAENGTNAEPTPKVAPSEQKTPPEPVKEASAEVAIASNVSTADADSRLKASPLAKAIAEEKGIDLSTIKGTGDSGRIIKRDLANLDVDKSAHKAVSVASYPAGGYKDIPLSQMRKTIARRLGESKFNAPHFYLTIEIDMENTIAARTRINAGGVYKLSYNDFVIKAAAAALVKHPQVNASWKGDFIRENYDIHIGVAVAVPDGLLVPVVRHANHLGLAAINAEVKELAGKAKDKKLSLDEMQGNTFTISNLGMFDIDEFTAIINTPDACILAVGTIAEKPVVKNGAIVPGHIMKVTLSCDHRVVDGAVGASFLKTFKEMMENPVMIMV